MTVSFISTTASSPGRAMENSMRSERAGVNSLAWQWEVTRLRSSGMTRSAKGLPRRLVSTLPAISQKAPLVKTMLPSRRMSTPSLMCLTMPW